MSSEDPCITLADQSAYGQSKAELPASQPRNFLYQMPELGSNPVFEKEGSSSYVFETEGSSKTTQEPAELEGPSSH